MAHWGFEDAAAMKKKEITFGVLLLLKHSLHKAHIYLNNAINTSEIPYTY